MTDFRIADKFIPENVDFEQELDWDRETKMWTLSQKAKGFGIRWEQELTPSHEHLKGIINFFKIPSDEINSDTLRFLSPGELALVLRNIADIVTLFALLCDRCGNHWYVFRWDESLNEWTIYGRTCDFDWKRGSQLTDDELFMLNKIKGQPEQSS